MQFRLMFFFGRSFISCVWFSFFFDHFVCARLLYFLLHWKLSEITDDRRVEMCVNYNLNFSCRNIFLTFFHFFFLCSVVFYISLCIFVLSVPHWNHDHSFLNDCELFFRFFNQWNEYIYKKKYSIFFSCVLYASLASFYTFSRSIHFSLYV